ncbi:hypothetical protein V8D89_002126 [Ganoderma adspersum]
MAKLFFFESVPTQLVITFAAGYVALTSSDIQLPPDSDTTNLEHNQSTISTGTGKPSRKRARTQTTEAPVEPHRKCNRRARPRRPTHYRIVVAQVCLPSSAFTSGRQLARLLWNCIDGETIPGPAPPTVDRANTNADVRYSPRLRAEQCDVLHGDVSAGNILIMPMVHINISKKGRQKTIVVWCSVLSDWELAQKYPDVHTGGTSMMGHQLSRRATSVLRHPRRAPGTTCPSVPPKTREARSRSRMSSSHSSTPPVPRAPVPPEQPAHPGIHLHEIDAYFAASQTVDAHGRTRTVCGTLKQSVVCEEGRLAFRWPWKPVVFLLDPDPQLSSGSAPRRRGPEPEPKRPRAASFVCMRTGASPIPTAGNDNHRDSSESEEETLILAVLQMFGSPGDARTCAPPVDDVVDINKRSPELQEPSDEEKERAARLGTHQYVRDLLFSHIGGRVLWPKEDHVGDYWQLEGHEERMKRLRGGHWYGDSDNR